MGYIVRGKRKLVLTEDQPYVSFIKVVQIQKKRMNTKHTPVTLLEVNATGLRFRSLLLLPIRSDIIWCFGFLLKGLPFEFKAVITGKQARAEGYSYAVNWCGGEDIGIFIMRMIQNQNPDFEQAIQNYTYFAANSISKHRIDLSC